jgi:hypothetical protein
MNAGNREYLTTDWSPISWPLYRSCTGNQGESWRPDQAVISKTVVETVVEVVMSDATVTIWGRSKKPVYQAVPLVTFRQWGHGR